VCSDNDVVQLCRDSARGSYIARRAVDCALSLGIKAAVLEVSGEPKDRVVELQPLDCDLPLGVRLEYFAADSVLWLTRDQDGNSASTLITSAEQLRLALAESTPELLAA
jgi:hypothetical protein